MTLTEAENVLKDMIRIRELFNRGVDEKELRALKVALKSVRRRIAGYKTIPVRFTPGDKIYYKDRNGKMQESVVRTVEPVYTHKTREGCKCTFDNTYIGEIIFPRD